MTHTLVANCSALAARPPRAGRRATMNVAASRGGGIGQYLGEAVQRIFSPLADAGAPPAMELRLASGFTGRISHHHEGRKRPTILTDPVAPVVSGPGCCWARVCLARRGVHAQRGG